MQRQTLCFLVLGASLAVLLQNLAKRRTVAVRRPVTRATSCEVIDLAAWKDARARAEPALSAR